MIKDLLSGLLKPVTDIFKKREERKQAREAARAKIKQAQVEGSHELQLNKDEYEAIATKGLEATWKDEYVTVSIMSIVNGIVLGSLLAAFGYPQMLEGMIGAVQALNAIGVDVGFIVTATVMAGLGLSVWKKF